MRILKLAVFVLGGLAASWAASAQEEKVDPAKDAPSRLLKMVKPKYTREALAKKIEGVVLVEFVIDEEGRVQSPRVLESVPGLDAAAVEAVLQWRFSPTVKDGQRVRATGKSPVTFCIQKGCKPPRGKPVEQ